MVFCCRDLMGCWRPSLELGTSGGWHPLFARQGKAERKQNTRNLENLQKGYSEFCFALDHRYPIPLKSPGYQKWKHMPHIFLLFPAPGFVWFNKSLLFQMFQIPRWSFAQFLCSILAWHLTTNGYKWLFGIAHKRESTTWFPFSWHQWKQCKDPVGNCFLFVILTTSIVSWKIIWKKPSF